MRGNVKAAAAVLALAFVLSALASASGSAVRLIGSSSTAAYFQKVRTPGSLGVDSFEGQTRLYERLRFDVLDIGEPSLTFHGFFTSFDNVSHQAIGDTRTRLYNAFFEYRPVLASARPFNYFARLGRQWVTSGVGSGILDGALVQAERAGLCGLTLFGGTLGIDRFNEIQVDKPSDSNRYGGEIRIHPHLSDVTVPEVAVSYANTHRNGKAESQRLGVRGDLRLHRELRIYSEVRHDFALARTYGTTAGIELQKHDSNTRLWFEYNRRTSALPATNFFSVFDQRPISGIRGGLGFGLVGPYRLAFDFERTDFRNQATLLNVGGNALTRSNVDRSKSYRLVLERGWAQIGGRVSTGFGGKQAGLVLIGSHDFGKLNLNLDLDYLHYNYDDNSLGDNHAASGILAAAYEVASGTRVTAQIEAMNNRDLKRDVRLLARVDQRFRIGR